MADEGFITREEADEAAAASAGRCAGQPTPDRSIAPYFVEDIRKSSSRSTAPTRCTRRACRCRRRSTPSCRRPPTRRSTAACGGSTSAAAATAGRRATSSPKGTTIERVHDRPLVAADARRRHRAGRGHGGARRAAPAGAHPHRRARGRAAAARRSPGRGGRRAADLFTVGDLIEVEVRDARGRRAGRPSRSSRRRCVEGALVAIDNRTGADSRDGRRLQLRAQQVQPRDAGAAPGRLAVQADRLHGGDRPRLHAGVGVRRRAGLLRGRARTSRRTSR